MFQVVVTGKLSQFKKLNVARTERYQGTAVLKEYARVNGVGFERYWLLWIPSHAMAFAEIQVGKGFTVAVVADGIATNSGEGLASYPDAAMCLAVQQISAV